MNGGFQLLLRPQRSDCTAHYEEGDILTASLCIQYPQNKMQNKDEAAVISSIVTVKGDGW